MRTVCTKDRSRLFEIGIIGTGTWGTALARMLCRIGHHVTCWSAVSEEIRQLKVLHTHPNLPGVSLPEAITFTENIDEVCGESAILVFAVPSVYVRATAQKAVPFIREEQIVVDVAKGIEPDTLMTMTEIIADVWRRQSPGIHPRLVALSGPTHAEEVAADMPTTIVAASKDQEAARQVQEAFSNQVMRVYTNADQKGVEISGAMKNVMALAAGIAAGMGYGDNLRAAIITRGIAEIARLGKAMGCNIRTFAGLAGVGDLIVTASSVHSRNNRAGQLIGQGFSAAAAIDKVGMVVEGINALPAAMKLSRRYHVEMPITEALYAVLYEEADVREAVHKLLDRPKRHEYEKLS